MQFQTPASFRPQNSLMGRTMAGAVTAPGSAGPPTSFSFPSLKLPEILQCLAELQIPFTQEDFERPNAQRMVNLYESFAEILMGITPDQFSQQSHCLSDDFLADIVEFPETHVESLAQLGFFGALNKLMRATGIPDYSLRDFTKPEPGRIRRILSGIINFVKFRESSLGVFEKYTTKTDDYAARRQDLEQQNAALVERLESLRTQRERDAPAIKGAQEKNAAMAASLLDMQKQQSLLTNEIEALKQEKAQLAEKMTNGQLLINTCKDELARLRSLIVQNPEQLKQVLVEMNNNLAIEKANLANSEKKSRDLQVKLELMASVEQDLTACVRLGKECEAEMRLLHGATAQIRKRQEAIESKNTEQRELAMKEQQLRRQLASTEERLARLQKQQAEHQVAAEYKLRLLREEYAALTSEQDRVSSVIGEHEEVAAMLSEKSAELRRQVEAELSTARQDYSQLREAAETYMRCMDRVVFDPVAELNPPLLM